MTDHTAGPARGEAEEAAPRVRVTDKRRIDPVTGEVRTPPDSPPEPDAATAGEQDGPAGAELEAAQAVAAERLEDLQRLQAEYVNYRRRVDRDRSVARDLAIVSVVESLLGVLDDVELAREHGELGGPFSAIAEKLEGALAQFGWERYGAVGEAFDPTVHEALMHSHSDDVSAPTVVQVLQPGHRVGERIVRAARVAVAEPNGS